MVKYTGSGLVVKRPGVLSKVQMLNLVLGVGVFSLLPILVSEPGSERKVLTRVTIRADFWGGNATKHFPVKKGVFSEKGEAIQ